jgi:hypothetical protein
MNFERINDFLNIREGIEFYNVMVDYGQQFTATGSSIPINRV